MGRYIFKLPDVGEGTAEAEIVAWHVGVGDTVEEDQNLVDVMTDKATVEMTSPVSGKVVSVHGEPGSMAAVGSPLVELEVEGAGNVKAGAVMPAAKAEPPKSPPPKSASGKEDKRTSLSPTGGEGQGEGAIVVPISKQPPHPSPLPRSAGAREKTEFAPAIATRKPGDKPVASPVVRERAHELGIELQYVAGSGPAGRITHQDLDNYVASGGRGAVSPRATGYAPRPPLAT